MFDNLLTNLDLTWPELVGVTTLMFGFAAYAMGQAVANKWQSPIYCCWYSLLLGIFDRFIIYALFDGVLLSLKAYIADTIIILVISVLAHRLTLVRKMIRQYPWLYRRVFIFSWKNK